MPAAPSEDALYFTPSYSRSLKVFSLSSTARSIAACASSSSSTVAITAPRKSSSPVRDRAPDGDLLAQPGRDVLLVVELRVLRLREGLRDELVDLCLRVGGAQDLARGRERVVALLALGADGRVDVEGGVRRHRARRVVAPRTAFRHRSRRAIRDSEMRARRTTRGIAEGYGRTPAERKKPCKSERCRRSCARTSVRTPLSSHLTTPHICRDFPSPERVGFKIGGTNDDNCVAEWVEVGYLQLAKPVRGGGAPPTPPPRID